MTIPRLLTTFAWLLVSASIFQLGSSFLGEEGAKISLATALPAGVLLALAGHLFTQAKVVSESIEKRSQFNLEGFRTAFTHASSLLEDGNNDRATWIEASRSIAHGLELAKRVTVDSHQRVLELERLKYRGRFHSALCTKTADFFYGVPQMYASLDDAACASSMSSTEHGRHIASTTRELSESSIRMVWMAAQWPDKYRDPVAERFGPGDETNLSVLYPSLHQFLEHTRRWQSIGGRLHER